MLGGPHDPSSSEWHTNQTQAGFIEVVLMDNRSRAAQRFVERGGPKTEAIDEEDPSTGFFRLYDCLVTVLKDQPQAARVDSIPGQVDQTYAAFLQALRPT